MHNIREDKQQLQAVIQSIGNALVPILPDAWEKAVIGYFIAGEITHLQLHAISSDLDDYVDLMELAWDRDDMDDAIIQVQQHCAALRRLCVQAHDSWTSMTFSLTCDGSFSIDYGYDAIEDYDAAYILNWQSRYLD